MQKTPALMKCSIQTVLSYVHAAAAKTESTQRAQTIKMDRTIRKINSSLVSSYMCGFRWRRVFVKCPWTSATYAVFRLLYLIMCCQKTHCRYQPSHICLGMKQQRTNTLTLTRKPRLPHLILELFHTREETLSVMLKGLKTMLFL